MKRLSILVSLIVLAWVCHLAVGQSPRDDNGDPRGNRPPRLEGGERGNRPQNREAKQAPAKTGVVKELTANPEGQTDGLLLEDDTEIRFRPESAEKVKTAIAPKDRVTIEGWTHAGETVIHAATIKHEASGKVFVVDRPPPGINISGATRDENGPPEQSERRRPPRMEEGGRGAGDEPSDRPRRPRQPTGGGRPSQTATSPNARPANPAPAGQRPVPSLHAEPGPVPGFMRLPAGEFDMGDHHGYGAMGGHPSDEVPIHRVRLDGFCIAATPTTNQQYCAFLNAALEQKQIQIKDGLVYSADGKFLYCDTHDSDKASSIQLKDNRFVVIDARANHPVVCIRWHGAAACCNWLSQKKGYTPLYDQATWQCDCSQPGFRLPTEAEWEYAGRGGIVGPYCNFPWGDDPDVTKANWPESHNPYRVGDYPWTTPVAFHNGELKKKGDYHWPGNQETYQTANGANGFGLYDMAGNVWQWVNDWYDTRYYAVSPVENPTGPETGRPMPDGKPYRGFRGGSWYNGEYGHSRVSNRDPAYYRGPNDPNHRWYHVGFRVVLKEAARPMGEGSGVRAERTVSPLPSSHLRDAGEGQRVRASRQNTPSTPSPRSNGNRSGFILTSPDVTEGGTLPKQYTGDGEGISPPLAWSGAPKDTRSYALIMHHEAPDMVKWYWTLYNIPADVMSLPKNVQGVGTQGTNSVNRNLAYAPPHSKGPGDKKYTITLYALSAAPKLSVSAAEVNRDVLLAAIKDITLASAELNVVYTRDVGNAGGSEPSARAERKAPPLRAPSRSDGRGEGQGVRAERSNALRDEDRHGEGSSAPLRDHMPRTGDDAPHPGPLPEGEGDRISPPRSQEPRAQLSASASTTPPGGHTVGLFQNDPAACPGYTLFAPKHHTLIYLMDNQGRAVHTWKSQYEPGQSVYLLENGHLLHCCFTKNRGFTSGGEGGRLEEFDWEGNLVWEFEYSTDQHLSHHDVKPLPNGNVLVLAVEKKSYEDCLAVGFDPRMMRDQQLFPEFFIEVQPTRPKGGKIVWQWHVWDHLIQQNDRTKGNYGDVAKHPELIDVNCNGRATPAFWNHGNSIADNAKLDQIMLSARGCNEIWVIDHGTTTEEAAGHTGGKRSHGGDLIYRWGNPAAYGQGTRNDRQLFQQHDAQWIPDGCPGAGHILIFNNGLDRGYSTIEEIVPPMDEQGNYVLSLQGTFGPGRPVWQYKAANPEDFYSSEISGAHRLPNGNTLICAGVKGTFLEVTTKGETVWQYVNPVVHNGILAQGELPGKDHRGHGWNAVFKIHRYEPDYPGLVGKELKPLGPLEQPAELCGKTGYHDQAPEGQPVGREGRGQQRPGGRRPSRDGNDRPSPPDDDRRPPREDDRPAREGQ